MRAVGLGLLMGWAFCAAGVPAAEPGFLPQWTKGQRWFVESRRVLLDLHERTPRASGQASPATTWEFRVAQVLDKGPLRYFQLLARDSRGKDPRKAGLIFVSQLNEKGRPVTLALASATFESPVKGRLERLSRDFRKDTSGPHPVLCEDSLIPCDVPCFSTASTDSTTARTYDVTEVVNGLPFARDVTQAVRHPADHSTYPREETMPFQGPKESIQPRVKSDALREVEYLLSRPSDGGLVHQIWNPVYPWAIYSRNQVGISYLLRPVPPFRPASHR